MKVLWTQESLLRLDQIERYISRNNPERSVQFVEMLMQKGESIAHNPEKGRVVPEYGDKRVRELIVGNYRMVYRKKQGHIEILTVFEGHRLLRKDEVD